MNRKRWILILLLAAILGAVIGLRMYFKPHADISKLDADYTINGTQLIEEFSNDENYATQKYMNKILEITGVIVEKEELHDGSDILLLEDELEGISCQLDSAWLVKNRNVFDVLTIGDEVRIKGRCEGALMEIKINPAIIVQD